MASLRWDDPIPYAAHQVDLLNRKPLGEGHKQRLFRYILPHNVRLLRPAQNARFVTLPDHHCHVLARALSLHYDVEQILHRLAGGAVDVALLAHLR